MNLLEHLFNSYKTWKQGRNEAKNIKLYTDFANNPKKYTQASLLDVYKDSPKPLISDEVLKLLKKSRDREEEMRQDIFKEPNQ